MSYGFTGLIFRVFATRFINIVTVRFTGAYDLPDVTTVRNGVSKRLSFKSKWLAALYCARINKGQYHRYENSSKNCGFKK